MNVRVALLQIASQHTKSGQRGVAGCPGIPGQIKSVWVAGSPRNTHGRVFDLTGSYQPSFIGLGVLALIGLVVAFYLPITDAATTGELAADQ